MRISCGGLLQHRIQRLALLSPHNATTPVLPEDGEQCSLSQSLIHRGISVVATLSLWAGLSEGLGPDASSVLEPQSHRRIQGVLCGQEQA